MWALRVSHSAVVDAWRERERALRVAATGSTSSRQRRGPRAAAGRPAPRPRRAGRAGRAPVGTHPALFLYDPRPLWRALGAPVDVLDIHEEPFALATAEVLLLRCAAPPARPVRALLRAEPRQALSRSRSGGSSEPRCGAPRAVSVCNDGGRPHRRAQGLPGSARVVPLGRRPDAFEPRRRMPTRRRRCRGRRVRRSARRRTRASTCSCEAVAARARRVLRIAGDGPARGRPRGPRGSGSASPDRVEFLGRSAPAALPDFYRGARRSGRAVAARPRAGSSSSAGSRSRRWPAASRSSSATAARCPRSSAAPPWSCRRATPPSSPRRSSEVGVTRDVSARLEQPGLARAAATSWDGVAADYDTTVPRGGDSSGRRRPDTALLEVVVVAYGQPELSRARPWPRSTGCPSRSSTTRPRPRCAACARGRGRPLRRPGPQRRVSPPGSTRGCAGLDPAPTCCSSTPTRSLTGAASSALRAPCSRARRLASVGPAQVDADGHDVPGRWPFPSRRSATWVDAAGLGRLRRSRFVIGSVLLLRREALDQVGPFDDERFFLYAEETDWAYAARSCWAGGTRVVAGSAC